MADKQVIINGCSVSGCPSYMENGECINENVYSDYCKACPNCKYKLEQQLDNLKQTLTEIKELLLKTPTDSQKHCVNAKSVILHKINEVIPNE